MRFFGQEMGAGVGAGENSQTQNVCNYQRRFASAVHPIISELIKRKALSMQRTKAGFIAKKRAATESPS